MSAASGKHGWYAFWLTVLSVTVLMGGCDKVGGPEDGNYTAAQAAELADCLSAKGAVLYGANWCPYTVEQKQVFGDAIGRITYVECTVDVARCDQAGVSSYPTWVIGGAMYPGLCDLATLAQRAGCP